MEIHITAAISLLIYINVAVIGHEKKVGVMY